MLAVVVVTLGGAGGCLGPNPLLTLQQQQAEDGSEAEDGAELGTEDGESEADEGETGGSMSSGDLPAGSCDDDAACMPAPLSGWQGPLHLYVGPVDELPPSCSGATPTAVAELFDGVDEHLSSSACACTCGPLAGASCSDIFLRRNDALGCVSVSQTWTLEPSQCRNLNSAQPSHHFSASSSVVLEGACTASLVEPLSPASYTSRVVACGPPEPASACDEGVCLPPAAAPFDGRVCIATPGAVQCPAGPYTERSTYYEDLDDDRSCASCSCEAPSDLPCTGKVQLSAQGCAGLLFGVIDVPGCSNNPVGSVEAARFVPDPIVGECEPSPTQILGEVTPTGAWTFCCL